MSTSILYNRRLRYLIGTDRSFVMLKENVYEVGYDNDKPRGDGAAIAYCNLFNEKFSEQSPAERSVLGPYLHDSDTAAEYGEGQIDPRGDGWERNLKAQFTRRKSQGFKWVELDNPDAYGLRDNLGALDMAGSYGFRVVAKNPLLVERSKDYASHRLVDGMIVERGAGTVDTMVTLRQQIGRLDLPIWFVAFGKAGRTWINTQANNIKKHNVRNAFCSYSAVGEYRSSSDIN